jgi:glutamate racemase
MKIGVFDSGVGGLSIARAVQKALPEHEVIFRNDNEHVPYGTRDIDEINGFVEPILRSMVDDGCRVIVIACNTVTTNLIDSLRRQIPIPLVGMEPMIKPAAEASSSGVIAVCATPRTLESHRYAWLKNSYASGITVLEPDCSDWTAMIENNQVDRDKIANIINDVCDKGADQIVLGCTHYHWIEQLIKESAGHRAEVLQPEEPVIEQLQRVLDQLS